MNDHPNQRPRPTEPTESNVSQPFAATTPSSRINQRVKNFAPKCNKPKSSDRPAPLPIIRVDERERMLMEEIVGALNDIDIDALPETSRADTVRGLLWALERLLAPRIEARQQHHVPFNVRLT